MAGTMITMRGAWRAWHRLESRLAGALTELERHYLPLVTAVEDLYLDASQGLLRTTAAFLTQPLEGESQELRQRLQDAFSVLGKSICRRPPATVRLDMMKFTGVIDATGARCRQLSGRLRLAHKILNLLRHQPDWGQPDILRQALCFPEAVWVTLVLRRRSELCQQVNQHTLTLGRQAKLDIGQRWLEILAPTLAPHTRWSWRRTLTAVTEKLTEKPAAHPSEAAVAQIRLDSFLLEINQAASEIIVADCGHRH